MKKSTLASFALLVILSIPTVLLAQPGILDNSFNPTDQGFGFMDGANSTIFSVAYQPDGKVLIGGDFTS